MPEETPLDPTPHGLMPRGQGWFVLNARDCVWLDRPGRGIRTAFEGHDNDAARFPQVGVHLIRLEPGEPMARYHLEHDQEDFLVVDGEAVLVVEGEERPLRRWDLAHLPAGTAHVVVGAGEAPCMLVAIGARTRSRGPDWGRYVPDAAAARHGASVEAETADPGEAYAPFPTPRPTAYRTGWLP